MIFFQHIHVFVTLPFQANNMYHLRLTKICYCPAFTLSLDIEKKEEALHLDNMVDRVTVHSPNHVFLLSLLDKFVHVHCLDCTAEHFLRNADIFTSNQIKSHCASHKNCDHDLID